MQSWQHSPGNSVAVKRCSGATRASLAAGLDGNGCQQIGTFSSGDALHSALAHINIGCADTWAGEVESRRHGYRRTNLQKEGRVGHKSCVVASGRVVENTQRVGWTIGSHAQRNWRGVEQVASHAGGIGEAGKLLCCE